LLYHYHSLALYYIVIHYTRTAHWFCFLQYRFYAFFAAARMALLPRLTTLCSPFPSARPFGCSRLIVLLYSFLPPTLFWTGYLICCALPGCHNSPAWCNWILLLLRCACLTHTPHCTLHFPPLPGGVLPRAITVRVLRFIFLPLRPTTFRACPTRVDYRLDAHCTTHTLPSARFTPYHAALLLPRTPCAHAYAHLPLHRTLCCYPHLLCTPLHRHMQT